jgi:hypothetical protein
MGIVIFILAKHRYNDTHKQRTSNDQCEVRRHSDSGALAQALDYITCETNHMLSLNLNKILHATQHIALRIGQIATNSASSPRNLLFFNKLGLLGLGAGREINPFASRVPVV